MKNIITDFLTSGKGSIEVFTNIKTGNSGISRKGLAAACRIQPATITQLIKKPAFSSFVNKDLEWLSGSIPKGGIIYNATFCEAVLKYYAKKEPIAADFLADKGDRTMLQYLQFLTGWNREIANQAKQAPIVPVKAKAPRATAQNNLERFDRDGIELIINRVTGEAYATASGYSRMSGIELATVRKRFERLKGYDTTALKTVEIVTPGGLQGCDILPVKLIFKWAIGDNPELAEAMGAAGATVYLHQLAGFKISSTAVESPAALELPPGDVRLQNLVGNLDKLGIDLQNPRYKQSLQDTALDLLGVTPPRLNGAAVEHPEGMWCGVVERAAHLGYLITTQSVRISIGKTIGRLDFEKITEDRFCQGTQRPIALYRVTAEFDQAIRDFFSR